jgi:hypothetical protein
MFFQLVRVLPVSLFNDNPNIQFYFLGYRGYGCTDDTHADISKKLSNVLFLTLSNLMFIPAIVLAIYRHLYIEALVYFFNMFFSTVSLIFLNKKNKTPGNDFF